MSCLELRRAAMIDPQRIDAALLEHAEHCETCREFLSQAREMETELEAMLDVPVPQELRARVFAEAVAGPRRSRRYALAAGVALGLAAGIGLLWKRDDPIALAGIEFVIFEEAQAILDAKPADPATLDRVVQKLRVMKPSHFGEAVYLGTCPFRGGMAHHVVVKTAHGKVTLLLMPDRGRVERGAATARGLEAVIAPAKGGSVAIIADSARSVERIESMLNAG